ncbi:cupin domain-containing protein [Natranaerobius trueperi]|uniref:Cupin n=1 Tax=Natranaerobius trueperi TaxID=759412 RepID=A0A226BV79_9FIRM|nr:cupin [Natranaerobius trueperi]OWZ82662.1 cupin [Natranaerobius trueperi]
MNKFTVTDYMVEPSGKVAKRVIYKDTNVLSFVLNISGKEQLPEHTHGESTVLLKILNGNGEIHVDGTRENLTKGELIKLDGPEKMSVVNTGIDTLQIYVTISPAPKEEKFTKDVDL